MAKGLILSEDVKRLTLYSPATRASSSMRNEGRGQARRASCVSWDVPRAGHGACRRAHRSRCARSPAHVSAPLLPPRWARCTHRGTAQLLQRPAGPTPPLRRLDRAERETGPSAQRDAGSVQHGLRNEPTCHGARALPGTRPRGVCPLRREGTPSARDAGARCLLSDLRRPLSFPPGPHAHCLPSRRAAWAPTGAGGDYLKNI